MLSSLHPYKTCEQMNIDPKDPSGVFLVRLPGALVYVCHATPLSRRLAIPFVEHAHRVALFYDENDVRSMVQSRRWTRAKNRNIEILHNTIGVI